MAQQLNKSRSKTIGGRFGLDPVGDMFIADPAEEADAEDKRIKQERKAFEAEGINATKESLLAQQEVKKRSKPKASGLQSSATTTTSLLR